MTDTPIKNQLTTYVINGFGVLIVFNSLRYIKEKGNKPIVITAQYNKVGTIDNCKLKLSNKIPPSSIVLPIIFPSTTIIPNKEVSAYRPAI